MQSKEDENDNSTIKSVYSDIEEPVTAIDNCIPLKILLIVISQALIAGTISLLVMVSSKVPKG
jgi:hypothetical protein